MAAASWPSSAAALSASPDRSRPADETQRLHAVVQGSVQGVGFRAFVESRALALGLQGSVRNRSDGAVECCAEGEREVLEALLTAIRSGPRLAVVEQVEVSFEPARGDLATFRAR